MKIYDEENNLIKDVHDYHHRSLEEVLEERKAKKERTEKVKTSVMSSVVIALVMAVISLIWDSIQRGG